MHYILSLVKNFEVSPCTAAVQKNKSYMHGSFFCDTLPCTYVVIT